MGILARVLLNGRWRPCPHSCGKIQDSACEQSNRGRIVWGVLGVGDEKKQTLSVQGGVLVICHRIRYPDKAIGGKQILQPHGFNALLPHPDELLKNGVRLELVLYDGLRICLLSGLLPPVFIGCKGLLINLPLLLSGQRGQSERQAVGSSQHQRVRPAANKHVWFSRRRLWCSNSRINKISLLSFQQQGDN